MATVLNNECLSIIIGEKGSGKSTLLARIAIQCNKLDIPVYSNYPIKGTYRLPTITNQYGYEVIDKKALYTGDFSNSVVLIDEGANIWNARSHKNFTEMDSHWFNMLRHINCRVFVVTQYLDMIDLNIKRNATEIINCTKSWIPGFTKCDRYFYNIKLVKNTMNECLDKHFDDVEFKNCLSRYRKFRFRRKKYYPLFHSYYIDSPLIQYNCPKWDSLVEFGNVTR